MNIIKEPLISNLFSKTVVIFCIGYMVRVTERVMDITLLTGVDASNILLISAGFYGGELLFLALRSALKYKDDTKLEQTKVQADAQVQIQVKKNKNQDCD